MGYQSIGWDMGESNHWLEHWGMKTSVTWGESKHWLGHGGIKTLAGTLGNQNIICDMERIKTLAATWGRGSKHWLGHGEGDQNIGWNMGKGIKTLAGTWKDH